MTDLRCPAPWAGMPPLVPDAGRRLPPAPPASLAVPPAGRSPLGPVELVHSAPGSELREVWIGAVRSRGLLLPAPLRWREDGRPAIGPASGTPRPPVLVPGPCAAAALHAMATRGADPRRVALRDLVAILRDWATARPGGVLDRHDPLAQAILVLRPPRLAGLPACALPLVGSPGYVAVRLGLIAEREPRLARLLPGGGGVLALWRVLRALPRTALPGEVAFALGLPTAD